MTRIAPLLASVITACLDAPARPGAIDAARIDGGFDAGPPDAALDAAIDAAPTGCVGGYAGDLGGTLVNVERVTGPAGEPRLAMIDKSIPGTWESPIFDSGVDAARWVTLSWLSVQPYLRELPGGQLVETIYPDGQGEASMANNVILYRMEATSPNVADASANGPSKPPFPATCALCPVPTAGAFFGALAFVSNDAMSTGDVLVHAVSDPDGEPLLEPGEVTVEAWVRVDRAPDNSTDPFRRGFVFTKGHYPGDVNQRFASYALIVNPDLQLRCYVSVDPDGAGSAESAGHGVDSGAAHTLALATWQHVACTYDGTSVDLFIDGEHVRTEPIPGVLAYDMPPLDDAGNDAFVGGFAFTQFFDGAIDELAVYGRALSPTEIRDRHRRRALRLLIQLRTCDDDQCAGETFVGPDRTPSTWYTELCPPTFNTIAMPPNDRDCDRDGAQDDGEPGSAAPDNRYFQGRVRFESDVDNVSPQLERFGACLP